MAKVGIMSMQRIINYGSFLQAYGLRAILEDLGHEVCFVDYHAGSPLVGGDEKTGPGWGRKTEKALEAMRCDAPLMQRIQFIFYKKDFASRYHGILGLSPRPNYQPELDVLLVGSDEVFNCIQANPNVGYSPELFGEGHRADRLVSYAASFGNTTLEKLEKSGKAQEVGGLLKRFDAISVRDRNSGEIVRTLSAREPGYHLDPVLIYDFMGKCRRIPEIPKKEKYLILYAYSGRVTGEENRWIQCYARRKGWKIYAIGGIHKCADKFIGTSPFEVLAYFQNAEEVITDTFHGTCFSVIARKRFVTLIRRSEGASYGNEEKLADLLGRLGLESRGLLDIRNAAGVLEMEIDYMGVGKILKEARQEAHMFLGGW